MISISPSAFTSPTMAATLLVPMSRPTILFRSLSDAITISSYTFPTPTVGAISRSRSRSRIRGQQRSGDSRSGDRSYVSPLDGDAVGVAGVNVDDLFLALGQL